MIVGILYEMSGKKLNSKWIVFANVQNEYYEIINNNIVLSSGPFCCAAKNKSTAQKLLYHSSDIKSHKGAC